ncbi:MAG: hypothetical protein Q4E36_05660 [Bacillota bacterium]|nr:hypothetical protein [Bacillota bacterium]
MNKTVLKDIFREIRKNLGRFFSIMALLFISVLAFSGVFMATDLLELTPEHYYNKANMHDVIITSTLGLSKQDAYIIENNPLVEDFEMFKSIDVLEEKDNEIVRLEALSQTITRPLVVEGRLPEKVDEIALSNTQFKDLVKIGDTISFVDETNDQEITGLKRNEYKIVGLVDSVEHISELSSELTTIGSGTIWSFAYIMEDNFDIDYYSKAKIKGKGLQGLLSHDSAYEDQVEVLIASLEEDFKDRPRVRLEEFKEEIAEEIKDAEEKLEDARQQLADAKEELDQGKIDLLDAKVELQEGEVDVLKARDELNDGWADYYQGLKDLEKGQIEGQQELDDAKAELEDARIELEDGRAELEKARKDLEEGRKELEEAKADFKEGEDLYLENLKKFEDGKRELEEEKEKIRISKEIKYGNLSKFKTKEELRLAIADLESQVENHKINLENYKAQLAYNQSIVETDPERELVEEKIQELSSLIEKEDLAINTKTEQIQGLKTDLENFEKVEKEGPVGDDVINYGDEAIEEAERELAQGQKDLDEAKLKLEDGRKELEEGIAEFEKGQKEFNENEQKLIDGEKDYQQGLIDYEEGKQTLAKEIADGKKELADAKIDLDQGEKDLAQAKIDLAQGWEDYEEGLKEYQDGLEEYNDEEKDANKKINKGQKEIADAKKTLSKLKKPSFMIDSRKANQMYYMVYGFPGSLKILALVFSILCLAVAVLVASTTMTRMVDERRVLIGTFKGLGYENSVIALKFLIFGTSSGLVGSLLGNYFGQKILAPIIYNIYMANMFYSQAIDLSSTTLLVFAIILAIITTAFSAYLAVNKTLKENTASLLRPKAPKVGKKLLLERIDFVWNKLSFMNKITARNIFRYKGRMSMTIIGVAVCMALMILGFGMRNSIQNLVDVQFTDLLEYDLTLGLNDDKNKEEQKEIEDFLKAYDKVKQTASLNAEILKLPVKSGFTQDVSLMIDLEGSLENLINLRDYKTGQSLQLDDSGVILTEKIADLMDVKVGDSLILEVDDQEIEVRVAGLAENYMAHFIYASHSYMKDLAGKEFLANSILVDLVDNEEETINSMSKLLIEDDNIMSVVSTNDTKAILDNTLNSLDVIIIIIVAVSMLLALVVLYNLTNINVSERVRELSTMKVLGFYPGEITMYVYKETFVLSLIGIFLGMILGKAIVEFILAEFAPENILFGDPAYLNANFISAIFTILFTLVVMVLMHLKLKKIDMIEALKSID